MVGRRINLVIPFKQVRLLIFWNSRAEILHRNLYIFPIRICTKYNLPGIGRVLHRITYQVRDHLVNSMLVSINRKYWRSLYHNRIIIIGSDVITTIFV